MKPAGILVNVSRGGVVDEPALFAALTAGTIAAAALDVVEVEGDTRLSEMENVVLTPHIGAMTAEAQARIARVVVASIRDALAGCPVATAR
jgi:phosphoglycerate dehydrogenase-like enzyme